MSTASEKNEQRRAMPIRVGVYSTADRAEQAVSKLLAAGFAKSEITVFCPSETGEACPNVQPHPDTGLPVKSLLGGSLLGSALGGLTAVAGLATVAGIPVLVAGGMAGALTGGVAGGLVGVMSHRGVEKEPANYFDQAVAQGSTLVAVEPADHASPERLNVAARILKEAGAKPLSLRQG